MCNGFTLSLLTLALIGSGVHAATIIEMESGPARLKSTMTVEKDKARLQSELANYSLIDPNAGQFLYVAQDKKQVVKMYGATPIVLNQNVSPPSARTRLVNKGPGQKIAGYATRLYQLYANGTLCMSTYLSRDAMTQGQLKEFHAAFYRMQIKQKHEAKASGAEITACGDAEEVLMARYTELGLPMRTVFPNGEVRQEIVSIKTGVEVAANFFQPPLGFKQLSYEEHLREMERGSMPSPAGEKAETGQEAAPVVNK